VACSNHNAVSCEDSAGSLFETADSYTVPTVARRTLFFSLITLTFGLAPLLMAACGSSSETEAITAPSSSKCAMTVNVDGTPFPAAGGSGALRIATNRDCPWTAKADTAWVTIGQPTDGQGDGSVPFSVGANGDPASRTAGIAVNDQRFEISQAGKPCEFTLSSNHESVDGAGGDLSVNVRTSATACDWTATSNVSWISIASGRTGRGSGSVTFHVEAGTGPPRSGAITIGGQTVQVDQGTGCSYAIGTDAFTVDAGGGERQVVVTASAGCAWTSQSQAPWITIVAGATGGGPGVVVFRVAPADGPARTGTLTIAGRTVTVSQSVGCTYSVAPATVSVGAQGSDTVIQVDAGGGCAWSAASTASWISIGGTANGSGPGQVHLVIAANDSVARTAQLTIAGRPVTIAQASGCTYTIAPASQDVRGDGGSVATSVTSSSGCAWTASSSADWITVATPSGSGSGQASFTITPNPSPPRTGTAIVAGRTLTINQASQCQWFFAPPSHDLPASGGSGNVLVFVTGSCSWTAVPNVPWIQITAGGSGVGGGLLQFVVAPNTGKARTGLIALGGEQYVVQQGGSD
jgi:hypothetical protein